MDIVTSLYRRKLPSVYDRLVDTIGLKTEKNQVLLLQLRGVQENGKRGRLTGPKPS